MPMLLFYLSFSLWAATPKVEIVLSQTDVVWGFDFLPENRIIFTLRGGKMGVYDGKSKQVTYLENVPKVYEAGQAGLLDVRVHPEFASNGLIYFSYSEPVGEKSTTAVARAKLGAKGLENVQRLFSAHKANDEDIHYGSRIVFHDKHIYFSVGDRDQRERAQDLSYHQGKILRLKEDGTVPSDNPFVKTKGAKPEIWSYGHRNPQGLVWHEASGTLYESEFGPRGGDEVNVVKPGLNYGWPVITYGREYYGPKIGTTSKAGMEQPLVYWVPSISPSAMTVYTGDKFPEWKNDLFLANLSGNHIRRVSPDGKKQEILVKDLGYRFRNVRTGPDGYLYFSTDEGKLGYLKP